MSDMILVKYNTRYYSYNTNIIQIRDDIKNAKKKST